MSDGVTNTATATATASGVVTATGSFVGLVNEWAVVIGFVLTIASLLFAIYSHRQTMKWREKQDEEKVNALVEKLLAERQGGGE